ncbi:hypothetical protein KKE45_00120 [Patescibacteria group bacterium]|nr:hypothetical protein [Patescibacteria group bacterium]
MQTPIKNTCHCEEFYDVAISSETIFPLTSPTGSPRHFVPRDDRPSYHCKKFYNKAIPSEFY